MEDLRQRNACPNCGYGNDPEDGACSLCGELLRTAPSAPGFRPATYPVSRPAAGPRRTVSRRPRTIAGLPEGAFFLLVGAPIALLLSSFSLDLLGYVGWFLTALVHEMGHTAAALVSGSFAYPAIRLDGHAAAFHEPQSIAAAVSVWAVIGGLAWWQRGNRRLFLLLVGAAVVYPAFAFTGLREYVHLAAGHLGELAFATVFFARALKGGFTGNPLERPFYSALAWLWMGGNVLLFGSLLLSEESRQWYLGNGSFGLENDFVRIARMLDTSLPTVAAPMLLLSFLPLPVAGLLSRSRSVPR